MALTKEQEEQYRECWKEWKRFNIIENTLKDAINICNRHDINCKSFEIEVNYFIKYGLKRKELSGRMMELEKLSDGQYEVGCHIDY